MNKPAEVMSKRKKPVSIFQADKKVNPVEKTNSLLKDSERDDKNKDKDFLFPVKTLFA